jgi:hypothetical protein
MAVSVFAFHTSHQTTKAIDMCRKIIPLTEKLITEMPCYVYPYANIFSVLPFLHVYQLNDLVEKIQQIFRAAQSSLGNLCIQQHYALVNNKPLQPFFSRTVGGWGQLKLPVIQFGSVAPQGMPSQVLQPSPMRTNEEIQQNLTKPPQQQQVAAYQQTNANKRQRLNTAQVEEVKSELVLTPPNHAQHVTYSTVSRPVQQDRQQYVVARPQGYYPQQHGYVQPQQEQHYAQAYSQQHGYPQHHYPAVVNETEESSYSPSQEYQDQQHYDNTIDNTYEYPAHPTHPVQQGWAITAVAQTTNNDNNVYNLHAQQENQQHPPHAYYVNTKHSGKHEDIL